MSISENIAAIRREIHLAAAKTGRTGADITLVGASNMNDAAACREAIAAGIDVLGENRVQEMTQKLAENAYDGVPLHFIGHLQRNKVKQVVGKAALIQSVSSMALLDEIEKNAEKLGIVQDILLEVNIGGEEAKSGFAPESLEQAACREALEETGLHIRDLAYFGNQPWPYPSGLMVGVIADYAGGEIKLQEEELSSGDFYTRDNLPELPRKLSLARKMIDWWLECSHK